MEVLKVTDSESNLFGIVYLYGGLSETLGGAAGKLSAYSDGDRSVLEIELPPSLGEHVRREVEDKISDVIAVSYKHSAFASAIHPYGLNGEEREILISALISADIDDDREYIKRKIVSDREYAVDGLFNFRLSPLKRKWQDVISYIPKTFDGEKLKDFIAFILEEKRGRRVFVDGGRVYDKYLRRINRTSLTGVNYGSQRLVNEILLSGAGEAELLTSVAPEEEESLTEYLGGKIIFGKTFFSS